MNGPRTLRWALLIGAGLLSLAATGCARRVYATTPGGGIAVYQAPPPARVVVQRPSQPYANAVWVEGHYEWDGYQHVWVDGYWVEQRPGYSFAQPRWVQQGNRHVYIQGGWARGGRVVHHVGRGGGGVYVGGNRGGVVVNRGYAQPRGRVVVQQRGPVYQRRGPVYQQRGGGVYRGPAVRATSPGGATVTVRPR